MEKTEPQIPAEPDLVQEVQVAWRRFSKHSENCSECEPLAQDVRRHPGKPPYTLIKPCCEDGRGLVEQWIYACDTLIEHLRDRRRLRVL